MHMADALISPVVGGTMWAAAAGVAAYSIKKIQNDLDEKKVPLMGPPFYLIMALRRRKTKARQALEKVKAKRHGLL